VISLFDPRRIERESGIIEKLRRIDDQSFLSVLTLAEVEAGILKLDREDKRQRAQQLGVFRDGLITHWSERILPITTEIALIMARIAERAPPAVVESIDLMIAATASVHGYTVVTRNGKHFELTGVPWVDPSDLP
jgi:predicted nucleic acid-binding protein